MKKLWLIGFVVIMATLFLAGCPSPASPPVEPPVQPIPPTWSEIVQGKFWQVDGIEKYQDTRSLMNPYEKDICMFWDDDEITFWEDDNGDGLLSPSEQINGSLPYDVTGNILTIGPDTFEIDSFDANGWSMVADVTGTTLGDWLGGSGEPYEGWVRIHYVPCLLMFDDNVLSGGFAFVFDDMGDVTGEWIREYCKRWKIDIDVDDADGFYFTSGTPIDSYLDDDPRLGVHFVIVSFYDGRGDDIDTFILIGSEEYGFDDYDVWQQFDPNAVYDMVITVDSADAGNLSFVSRVDGDAWDIDVRIDRSEMGELIIRKVDDVDVPVVNPTL
jgi:hypothetical protein